MPVRRLMPLVGTVYLVLAASAALAAQPDVIATQNEFDVVAVRPTEPGAAPNDHPVNLAADRIRPALEAIHLIKDGDEPKRLFTEAEARFLAKALQEGLAVAGPGEDISFLTTGRHSGILVFPRVGTSGRVFHADGRLNIIVAEAHVDFIGQYRGAQILHDFTFGSRGQASPVVLSIDAQSGQAVEPRRDWLVLATSPGTAASSVAGGDTRPASTATAAAVPASFEERLRILKRLHEQALITEDEYETKRREILGEL